MRNELERVFQNPRFADIAMEAMPPIDYDKLATKDDLVATRDGLTVEITALRTDMTSELAAVRADMTSEFAAVRADMSTEFASVRIEMAQMRSDMDAKFVSHMRLTFLMQVATFGAIISYLNAAL